MAAASGAATTGEASDEVSTSVINGRDDRIKRSAAIEAAVLCIKYMVYRTSTIASPEENFARSRFT